MTTRWAAGDTFGRYRIEALLGRGGMGEVYLAQDTQLGRRVALKVLHGGADDEKLIREARAAAAIDHPNVAQVFDVDTFEGVSFLAMEHVEGKSLRAYVGDRHVTLDTKVRWLVAIGRALEAAHARGIVHRDVKPENVIVGHDGVAKVLDFGIARVVPLVDRGAETRTGPGTPQPVAADVGRAPGATSGTNAKGTLAYMAPEQIRGETIDASADQWAWGVVAYELLTGRLPWRTQGDDLGLVAQILSGEPAEIGGPSGRLDRVVRRSLRKRRAERFEALSEAIGALEAAITSTYERNERAKPFATEFAFLAATACCVLVGALLQWTRSAFEFHESKKPTGPNATISIDSPMSANPSAVAAYRRGIASIRNAESVAVSLKAFEEARKLDPDFAPAYLRALALLDPTEGGYELFNELLPRRARLGEHDRALLDAIEPWFRVPSDAGELRKRLEDLTASGDADYAMQRCFFLVSANAFTEARDACRAASLLDSDLAMSRQREGVCAVFRGDMEGAEAHYRECLELSPNAVRCMRGLADVDASLGKCTEDAAIMARIVEIAPDDIDIRRRASNAILGRDMAAGRDMQGYRAAVDAQAECLARNGAPPSEIVAERLFFGASALVAEGRFAEAVSALEHTVTELRPRAYEGELALIYDAEVSVLLELGRDAEAATFARRWIADQPAWVPNPYADSRIQPLGVLYVVGAISRERFRAERKAWLGRAMRESEHADALLWPLAYGQPIVSDEDAREALDALANFDPMPSTGASLAVDVALGVALSRAGGDWEPRLREAARSCDPGTNATLLVQASAHLGDALSAAGDATGACAAYRAVLLRWGADRPARSARRAREMSKRLDCPQ